MQWERYVRLCRCLCLKQTTKQNMHTKTQTKQKTWNALGKWRRGVCLRATNKKYTNSNHSNPKQTTSTQTKPHQSKPNHTNPNQTKGAHLLTTTKPTERGTKRLRRNTSNGFVSPTVKRQESEFCSVGRSCSSLIASWLQSPSCFLFVLFFFVVSGCKERALLNNGKPQKTKERRR